MFLLILNLEITFCLLFYYLLFYKLYILYYANTVKFKYKSYTKNIRIKLSLLTLTKRLV